MSDELLTKLLSYDPLDNAEHITGKSYKTDERTMAIGFIDHLRATQERRETLELLDDTAFSNTVERYTRIITEEGFERVLEIPFTDERGKPESFQVWFHPDGLLLKWPWITEPILVEISHLYTGVSLGEKTIEDVAAYVKTVEPSEHAPAEDHEPSPEEIDYLLGGYQRPEYERNGR